MILLVDNYDSFSYNLVQLVGGILKKEDGTLKEEIKVIRNDELTVQEIEELNPSHLILSPGPGRPADAGICEEAVQKLKDKMPILGVCLGHQGICESFGAVITYAENLMHGKQSDVELDTTCPLFEGMEPVVSVARYHSLVAKPDSLPDELRVVARDVLKGEIMAVEHKNYKIYGLQFHPESVLTPQGRVMMENFLKIK